jgi:DNA polymerase III delta prime subunit
MPALTANKTRGALCMTSIVSTTTGRTISAATVEALALPPLTPSQQVAFGMLTQVTQAVPVVLLEGGPGSGKTTLLRHLQATSGGRLISIGDALGAIAAEDPMAIDEAILGLVGEALTRDDLVICDDLGMIEAVMLRVPMPTSYPRPLLFDAVLKALFTLARQAGKTIVVSRTGEASHPTIQAQAVPVSMPDFTADDYAAILAHSLGGENAARLDVERVFRHARKLTGYQLENVCRILQQMGAAAPTTDQVIACIDEHVMASNLDLAEVEPIAFEQLKGAEALIEQLEILVLLPSRDPQLAKELGLKSKRGVLLHGAPGTGKTSIGRALAHQMKGKFFMIDGTFTTEPPGNFFRRINAVFAAAKANSPSVIFIDDADVLFKTDHVFGLNRYLLTKLDGLESESAGGVCVMMTAMNLKDLPPAILRSGRVEVWLETRLPDLTTRQEIIRYYSSRLPPAHQGFDVARLAFLTEGFTPADLRRTVDDAKAFMAYDMFMKRPQKSFGAYVHAAGAAVRDLRNRIAKATGQPELPKSSDDFDTISACC